MRFLIWSREHKGWWRPNWDGYTRNRSEAGAYDLEEAAQICKVANFWIRDDQEPEESMVPAI